MAYIEVNSTTNSLQASFGVYSGLVERTNGAWRKENVSFKLADYFIEVNIEHEKTWFISTDGNATQTPTLIVGKVNDVAPTDLNDLYDKLAATIA